MALPPVRSVGNSNHVADHNAIVAEFALVKSLFNVKSYGALGDGSANDSTAIQAAITAAAGGGIVFVPPGTYLTTAALVMGSNVWLTGAGDASIIKSNSLTAIASGCAQIDATSKTGWRITDLAFDCSAMTSWPGGQRCIYAQGSTKFRVARCSFLTPGSSTSCVTCTDYWITDNRIVVSSTDSTPKADAVIDNWSGSHDFHISGNTVDGASVGDTAILVTGINDAAAAAACYNFTVTDNQTKATRIGIGIQGLSGVNHDFTVTGNRVASTTLYHGIIADDCRDFTIVGNTTSSTAASGIKLWSDTANGGTTGCVNAIVANNVVSTPNTGGSGDAYDGAGIAVTQNSNKCSIRGNRVRGTGHTYAVSLGPSVVNVEVEGFGYDAGTSGTFLNNSSGSVTAAATLPLTFAHDVVTVNGNTGITGITASVPGRRVTLVFSGTPTVTDGGNLFLAGNFVATANDTLSLVCDGTNWFETGRSAN